jgi:hypothetical protein
LIEGWVEASFFSPAKLSFATYFSRSQKQSIHSADDRADPQTAGERKKRFIFSTPQNIEMKDHRSFEIGRGRQRWIFGS